ncbi:BnaC04g32130D [Brassica napus]|uniref:(rape) hypothetical protein n=1 Tax=Brassica napus TaxID=3708 RepID=A0A078HEN0_BRANA|nr:unnamed protein product [Brassica napus]CDY36820.1 BnaC04g32130D [Brassica napus]
MLVKLCQIYNGLNVPIKRRRNELGDAHLAPTLTRYSRSLYSSPTTGRGR